MDPRPYSSGIFTFGVLKQMLKWNGIILRLYAKSIVDSIDAVTKRVVWNRIHSGLYVDTPYHCYQLKSVGPKLVLFLKTVALYFIIYPQLPINSIWVVFFKCAPVVSLMAFVLMHGMNLTEAYSYSRRILCGLVFSCIGDACLVFPNYFYHGLGAFTVAHICYAFAFGFRPMRWGLASPLLVLLVLNYSYIYPGLSGMLVYLCLIYSILIAVMLWRALARVELFDDLWTWTKLCSCIGAVLFCISDTFLSLDRFRYPIPYAQTCIMVTYYAAQLGITLSVVDSHVDNVILDSDIAVEDCQE